MALLQHVNYFNLQQSKPENPLTADTPAQRPDVKDFQSAKKAAGLKASDTVADEAKSLEDVSTDWFGYGVAVSHTRWWNRLTSRVKQPIDSFAAPKLSSRTPSPRGTSEQASPSPAVHDHTLTIGSGEALWGCCSDVGTILL